MPLTGDAVTSMGLLTLCTLAVPGLLVTWGASRSDERATARVGRLQFVVAVSAGWLFVDDRLSSTQISGVALVLVAATHSASRESRPDDRAAGHSQQRVSGSGRCRCDTRCEAMIGRPDEIITCD
jgi:drug/metabolite transporter (DMT)-like permease